MVSLGEEYASWGSLYPRLNIEQVLFQVDESLLSVTAAGDLPLYQTHNFEKAVKKWFLEGIQKRQREFKQSLQSAELNVWKNVPFSQSMFLGAVTLNNSLAESMRI